jgi:hypothetical protein
MNIKKIAKKIIPDFLIGRLGINHGIQKFAFDPGSSIQADIKSKYGFHGDLLDFYVNNQNQIIHKWHHYIPLYDRYFSRFRGTNVRFLEIGVSEGGSLQMWRKYFGDQAEIFGIDIDKNCFQFNGLHGQVRIGSQDDTDFLQSVIEEMGGIDVVLDDGSHHMQHIRSTFDFLFQKLNDGGVYMIEDLHTAYWRQCGGSYHSKFNFFRFIEEVMHDMHHWYHDVSIKHPGVREVCSGIHIHDSIAVFEKNPVHRPTHSKVG